MLCIFKQSPKSALSYFLYFCVFSFLCFLSIFIKDLEASNFVAAPVPVEIGIQLNQLVEVDQKKESFTAIITIKAKWNDPLLKHSDSDNDNAAVVLSDTQFQSLVLT